MKKVNKITQEQLDNIKDLQNKLSRALTDVGYLEAQKQNLLQGLKEVNNELELVKVELEKEYGPINIDIATGEYTVVETEKNLEVVE
jgi:hypothetical protein